MEETIDPIIYFRYSPYFALLTSEPKESQLRFFAQYQKLPESIKDFLISSSTADYLWSLGQSNNIPEEQLSDLAALVRKIVIQEVPLENVTAEIMHILSCDEGYASELKDILSKDLLTSILPALSAESVAPAERSDTGNVVDLRQLSK